MLGTAEGEWSSVLLGGEAGWRGGGGTLWRRGAGTGLVLAPPEAFDAGCRGRRMRL